MSNFFRITILLTLAATAMAATLATGAATASAQSRDPLPPLQLQRFRPAPGPGDYLTMFGSPVQRHLDWHVGGFADYADNPLQISTLGAPFRRTVDNQVHLSLFGSIGFLDTFEVGLLAPIIFWQTSENLQPILPGGQTSSTDLNKVALADWRLTAKYKILDLAEFYPFGLAFVTALTIPVGNDDAFGSDGGVGAEALLAADYVLLRALRLGGNLGFRYRPGTRQLRDITIGNELTWGVATHLPFITRNTDVLVELNGAVSLADKTSGPQGISEGEVPVEISGALRYRIRRNITLTGGLGSGLTNGAGTPNYRAFIGLGGQWVTGGWLRTDYGSPNFRGALRPCDDRDYGPNVLLDAWGCPVPEREFAGVPDDKTVDTMLNVPPQPVRPPEPEPEPQKPERVIVTERNIIITEQVHFATGKDTILEQSFPILLDIARVMQRNPQIELLRIEGHTDSVGREDKNLDLSIRRAASVRRFLIESGIDESRLESVGYGQSRPIADNKTKEGRAKNRRVEFTIMRTSAP